MHGQNHIKLGLPSLLIARPETFIRQVSWCSKYEKLKVGRRKEKLQMH